MHTSQSGRSKGYPVPPVRSRSTELLLAGDRQLSLQTTPHQLPACAPTLEAPPRLSLSPTPAAGQLVSATGKAGQRPLVPGQEISGSALQTPASIRARQTVRPPDPPLHGAVRPEQGGLPSPASCLLQNSCHILPLKKLGNRLAIRGLAGILHGIPKSLGKPLQPADYRLQTQKSIKLRLLSVHSRRDCPGIGRRAWCSAGDAALDRASSGSGRPGPRVC